MSNAARLSRWQEAGGLSDPGGGGPATRKPPQGSNEGDPCGGFLVAGPSPVVRWKQGDTPCGRGGRRRRLTTWVRYTPNVSRATGVQKLAPRKAVIGPPCSRRRDCHFADAPSPSTLQHLLKGEGGAAERQNSRRRLPTLGELLGRAGQTQPDHATDLRRPMTCTAIASRISRPRLIPRPPPPLSSAFCADVHRHAACGGAGRRRELTAVHQAVYVASVCYCLTEWP